MVPRRPAARRRAEREAQADLAEARKGLAATSRRLAAAGQIMIAQRRETLDRLDRLRQTLGHTETLRRGFAIVRSRDGLVTSASAAAGEPWLDIEFRDGQVRAVPAPSGGPADGTGVPVPVVPSAPPESPPGNAGPDAGDTVPGRGDTAQGRKRVGQGRGSAVGAQGRPAPESGPAASGNGKDVPGRAAAAPKGGRVPERGAATAGDGNGVPADGAAVPRGDAVPQAADPPASAPRRRAKAPSPPGQGSLF